MNTPNDTAIEFKNVSYSDGELQIIKDVTGTFPKGKITTLVGPSGAGKTTLFRLCNRLISPEAGEILVNGENIVSYEPTELRRMAGLALQSATMLSGSVYKNLSMPLTLQSGDLPEANAKDLLKDVGLEADYLHRNVKDLSGGQRQKVSIARTLVNKPNILLLDEITSSLDRVSQEEIETLIKKINDNYQVTIIWITHNLQQALSIGDYIWVMMDGKLMESGESSLLNNPQNNHVKLFVKGEIE
ncbi:phosphate ABC transporter ATP-binding protein [Virgibacillus profundi]|uniref:Phosphate ABC transporter ATP-binding protein n=1 Tax=Virgibacillus profundi TaxID=2024555 RepID=A0A2A2IAY3_9BACI|nr:phosphate ABC transporter ATP-binding protein [Virgibacillus profundi]PAV28280.1 phosphate ABC transporter ATP-binding protein [Virgibacillus profundi]PXY52584.1 phosphate ABC transporter ATP-binding protein [Virgibacillus profundi]